MIRSLNGKTPKIDESAFISEAAYIVGDVEIGENSNIWPGAVIRGDITGIKIGKKTAVEDNCVIHSGIIGDMVQVGHGAIINCLSIGNNVLIGMNATLLHNVEVGNNCIIAAGSMVEQGTKIPDNSFVTGVPAEIKSKITEKQFFWIKDAPLYYAELGKKYKAEGL
jgi:carbonic anhydrase/acetyltransferase-like protein (isoleucine patch superfamily)